MLPERRTRSCTTDPCSSSNQRERFDLPIRRGCPSDVGGLSDHVNSPTFATPVGLVLYAHRNRPSDGRKGGGGAFERITERFRLIFKEFF